MANTIIQDKHKVDIVKHRWFWLAFSGILLIPCVVAMLFLAITQENHAPLKLGIDFTGGSILQYSVEGKVETGKIADVRKELEEKGIKTSTIQVTSTSSINDDKDNLISIKTTYIGDKESKNKEKTITDVMTKNFKNSQLAQVNSVGPTLGAELLKKTMVALLVAFVMMVVYISFRFHFEYGWIALLTLAHDALFVLGIFAIKGIFFDTTIDSLFITAILTVIGYSINDTIVVFDRVRENMRFLAKKYSSNEIINASINQTLARSINTSATTLFTLLALYFFGGATIRDFVLAIIIGIVVGSYSSIFVAGSVLSIVKEKMNKNAKKA